MAEAASVAVARLPHMLVQPLHLRRASGRRPARQSRRSWSCRTTRAPSAACIAVTPRLFGDRVSPPFTPSRAIPNHPGSMFRGIVGPISSPPSPLALLPHLVINDSATSPPPSRYDLLVRGTVDLDVVALSPRPVAPWFMKYTKVRPSQRPAPRQFRVPLAK